MPLIHNVMNTDIVTAVSDRATDALNVVFNTAAGRDYLVRRRGLAPALVEALGGLGLSSLCNVIAAIKTAKYLDLGPDEAVLTVATDGAELYASEREKTLAADFAGGFDSLAAAEAFGRHVLGAGTEALCELTRDERARIFNLGYFTWVEQQGVELATFDARRAQGFWEAQRALAPAWDARIAEFNARTGVALGG